MECSFAAAQQRETRRADVFFVDGTIPLPGLPDK
jgi:hypothetical protein